MEVIVKKTVRNGVGVGAGVTVGAVGMIIVGLPVAVGLGVAVGLSVGVVIGNGVAVGTDVVDPLHVGDARGDIDSGSPPPHARTQAETPITSKTFHTLDPLA